MGRFLIHPIFNPHLKINCSPLTIRVCKFPFIEYVIVCFNFDFGISLKEMEMVKSSSSSSSLEHQVPLEDQFLIETFGPLTRALTSKHSSYLISKFDGLIEPWEIFLLFLMINRSP